MSQQALDGDLIADLVNLAERTFAHYVTCHDWKRAALWARLAEELHDLSDRVNRRAG